MSLNERIHHYIDHLKQEGIFRTRQLKHTDQIHFDSNDYLAMSTDRRIMEHYQRGFGRGSIGSTGSMLVNGYHESHNNLEKCFASFLGVDACILFPSGYAANLAVAALLGKIKACCLIDKAIHASIYDGLHLAGVQYQRFNHNRLTELSKILDQVAEPNIVLTEGIFSMSGQMAPLSDISLLLSDNQHQMIIDESHSFGVLGQKGKGAIDHWKVSPDAIPLRVIPLGKAMAGQGAIVAGNLNWVEALLQSARSLIYSTAISPAYCYGLAHALEWIIEADTQRLYLFELIQHFRECVQLSPLTFVDSKTQIQFLRLGCPHKAVQYATQLNDAGFSCTAIRCPTVTKPQTGIRIVLNASHREEHINDLFRVLHRIYEQDTSH